MTDDPERVPRLLAYVTVVGSALVVVLCVVILATQ